MNLPFKPRRFFSDLDSLNQYTFSLDSLANLPICPKCHRQGHFVSHGFIYRKRSNSDPAPVGKRIFCSPRYNRAGCGGSMRLYLDEIIPFLRYTTEHVSRFLCELMSGTPIETAYLSATNALEPRNAGRWMTRLVLMQATYRQKVDYQHSATTNHHFHKHRQLQLLLPVFQRINSVGLHFCSAFQLKHHVAFF